MTLPAGELPDWQRYAWFRSAVHDAFDVPETSITPLMARVLYGIAALARPRRILGIGLDEGTAIIVRGSTAETIGKGHAHFYDYRPGPPAGDRDFTAAEEGQRYDLVTRKRMEAQ